MKHRVYLVAALATGIAGNACAQVAAPDVPPNAAPNQWFTGSLEAPSPALPQAGMLALEPYFVFQPTPARMTTPARTMLSPTTPALL